MSETIDIRDWKEGRRVELGNEITHAVEDTQRVIVRPYPDKVRMTLAQYNTLKGLEPYAPFEYDMRFFKTKYNVMEIKIGGDDYEARPDNDHDTAR